MDIISDPTHIPEQFCELDDVKNIKGHLTGWFRTSENNKWKDTFARNADE